MKSLLIFALFISVTLARPQNFPGGGFDYEDTFQPRQRPGNPFLPPNQGNNNNNFVFATSAAPATSTAAPANTPTTASPRYLACLQSCPSTMEYNPICGTDSLNYHNNGRLICAQRCGKTVSAVRAGTCLPL